MVKQKLIKGVFKSWDEYYFSRWCTELAIEGMIREALYEPYPFILTEGLTNKFTVEEKLKTKVKYVDKEQVILEPSRYTMDFLIFWEDEVKGKLFDVLGEGRKIAAPFIAHQEDENSFSFIEIKPSFDRFNMTRLFINTQKDIWEKYEKYINLIKINDLFKQTFTPQAYLKTPAGKKRTPKWKVVTIKQFLK